MIITSDRLFGTVFGQALGDAVGYYFEFTFKDALQKAFGSKSAIEFPASRLRPYREDKHGDWTDDTDQLILILEMLIENNNEIDICLFAAKMKLWVQSGFSELGDGRGYGVGNLTGAVVNYPCFETDPYKASKVAWSRQIAPNGSIMRTAIMGCRCKGYEESIRDAMDIGKTTHWDPRCSVAVAVLVSIIWDIVNETNETDILSRARQWCFVDGFCNLIHGPVVAVTEECLPYFDINTLDDLSLNTHAGYALKCMGCAVWTFKERHRPYKDVILDILNEGGDADTNAAVAGAVLGAYNGYSKLPTEWLQKLPERVWLTNKLDAFLNVLNAANEQMESV